MIKDLLCRLFVHQDIVHEGSLYLRRFFLAPSVRGWELVLHQICRPDVDRALHNHPGDFATLCLRGGYVEEILHADCVVIPETLTAGQLRFRSSEHAHRITRILGRTAWTLVLRRSANRKWGFWDITRSPPWFTVAADYFKPGYDQAAPPRRGLRGGS